MNILVTGGAGFIGGHIAENPLQLGTIAIIDSDHVPLWVN